ncbi:MAG: hypothetical protein GX605_03140 [Chloroflexi bacterium]|nr:hypothetical protein [Chloroflexota bacterium]
MTKQRQVVAYLRMAAAAAHAGDYPAAQQWYRRALAMDPANPRALQGLDSLSRHRTICRWLMPLASFVLAVTVTAAALLLASWYRHEQPLSRVEASAPRSALATPAPPTPAEGVHLALQALVASLTADDCAALQHASADLARNRSLWQEDAIGASDGWTASAVHLQSALEAVQARRWSAAAEHLAAFPQLPSGESADLTEAQFMVLLRAGEADLAHYMDALPSRAESLRAADAYFAQARKLAGSLPDVTVGAAYLERIPLHFFEDFDSPQAAQNRWAAEPSGGDALTVQEGALRWTAAASTRRLASVPSGWDDYTVIVRLLPLGQGAVGLGVRCADSESCYTVWLPVADPMGGDAPNTPTSDQADPSPAPHLQAGSWQLVAVTVAGHRVAVTGNGHDWGMAQDATLSETGGVSLSLYGADALVDYVAVVAPLALPRE